MVERLKFWDYLIFNVNGDITGLEKNAPEEAKRAYKEWREEQAELKKNNKKI